MRVLIAGGTGFIGSAVVSLFRSKGLNVRIVSRDPSKIINKEKGKVDNMHSFSPAVSWDIDELIKAVNETDAVINLAGEPIINKRWTSKQKDILIGSRIQTTAKIVKAIELATKRPFCLINGSAIGYYGASNDSSLDEYSHEGRDFLATLCVAWEAEAKKAEKLNVRTVISRTGIVLGRGGGILKKMLIPFSLGLGGCLGSGNQWMSWIHILDLIELFYFILENEDIDGIINATTPEPVTNREFSKTMAKVLRRPAFLRIPAPILKYGLGEVSDMLLTGQRVIPKRVLAYGFQFKFPTLELALNNLFSTKS